MGGRLDVETDLPDQFAASLLWGVDYSDATTSQPAAIMDPEVFDSSGGLMFEKIGQTPWTPPFNTRSLGLFAQLA